MMKAVISRTMKKFFAAMGLMMAAIVSLVSCQPKELVSEPGRTMTIYASSELTKTTNDGLSTLWSEGDKLNVYYLDPAVSSSTSYVKAGVFTLSEGAGTKTGTFTGEAASTPSAATTWYAIYTGSSGAAPAKPNATADGDGYIFVGRSNGIDQPSYDSMEKVSASHCPMYGIAEKVPADGTPSFTMKQIASVIEFNVVNTSKASTLTINSLQLNEVTDVAGQYYLDITSGSPVLAGVEGKTITNPLVRIAEPAELQPGASAKIYLPVKPFVHGAEAAMNVEISGTIDGKVGTKTIALAPSTEAQRTFAAGKIKTVTVNLDAFEVAQTNTVAEVLNGEANTDYVVEDALVTMVYGKGFFITDGTGTILAYTNSKPSVKKGDKVTVSGQISTYSGMTQFNKPSVTVESSNNNVSLQAIEWAKEEVDEASTDPVCEYVSIASAEFSNATTAVVKNAEGASSATISMTAATDPAVTLAAGTFDVTGYIYGCHNGKVYMYVDSAEEVVLPQEDHTFVFNTEEGLGNLSIAVPEAGKGTVLSGQSFTDKASGVSISFDKGTATTDTRVYNSNGNIDLRAYASSSMIIAAPDGYSLTKVVFSGANIAGLASPVAEGEWNGKASAIEVPVTATVRINTIDVEVESGSSDPIVSNKLEVSPASLSFEAEGGNANVTITCDNSDWTWETSADWLSISRADSFTGIIVTASANTGAAREATITVKHSSDSSLDKTVAVSQAAGANGSSTIAQVLAGTVGAKYSVDEAEVIGVFDSNFFIKDNTGIMMVFNTPGQAVGNIVNITGTLAEYANDHIRQFAAGADVETAGSVPSSSVKPEAWGASQLAAAYEKTPNTAYISATVDFSDSGSTGVIEGTDVKVFVKKKASGVNITAGSVYTITGIVNGWSLYNDIKEVLVYVDSATKVGGGDEPTPEITNSFDVLTAGLFAAESNSYTDFSGAQAVNTEHTSAVYAGQSAKTDEGAIQLRSKNSNSGIVSTTSGGKIASVKIDVASGSNTIDVYGSNTPYTSAADLYATTGNSNQGTKLGSLSASGSIAVTGDYQYIGIRSNNGAVYISSITIYWK